MQNELGHSQVRNLDFLIIYCGLYIHFRYCEINIGVAYGNTFLHFHLPLSTVIQCIGNHKVGTFLLWPEGGTDSVQMNNAKYCQPEFKDILVAIRSICRLVLQLYTVLKHQGVQSPVCCCYDTLIMFLQ